MKIYYFGRRINGRFDSFKAVCKRIVRAIVRWSLISAAAYAIFMAGAMLYSTEKVTATTIEVTKPSPVLERIADCESGTGKRGSATQFKNGQVLMVSNTNKSVDVGKYQINMTYWGKKATELGYDITTEEGNTKMAEYLFLNVGTGPWIHSSHCWNR